MNENSTILAGVDFSSSSPQVLAHAAKIASATGCRVIAAHVISESRLRDWMETMGVEATTAERVEEDVRRLQELVVQSCAGVSAGVAFRIGKPYQALRDLVKEYHAELLIIGAHDVSKRRLGAVASHCARLIPADVLILRDWQGRMFRKIAACVDYSRSSAAGLETAITLAAAHQASLEILHVIFPPSRDPWGRALEHPADATENYEAVVRERSRKRLDAFLVPFADRLSTIEWKTTMLEGESPAAAITAHVAVGGIDLTVVGSHAGSWVEDFVLGSNTERLMHDSSSSVLIARDGVA